VKIADISIRRPVFTTMVMVAIMAFGGILYARLAVDLFPDVDFPVVTVTTVYPGADPETMETRVSDPIEEALNSLAGIETLRSTSLESVALVVVQFDLDVDLDVAAQDVRDRVSGIIADLPDGAETPVVEKLDLGAAPVMQIAVHGDADPLALSRWVDEVVKPELERVSGVGTLEVIGGQEREIHVWLDPGRLRALGLTALDVIQALAAQNTDVPGGRVGDARVEQTVRTTVEADSLGALGEIIVGARGDGSIRLRDVARLEDGLEEERSRATLDGRTALAVVVQKQSGANTVAVVEGVREALTSLRGRAPDGVHLDVVQDNSVRIRGSLDAVQFDLLLGAFLAVAIIFVFLRDWRATLISALALPASVLGTFVFVSLMGFSLNLMTTLALSLSIGILIDDAIVVIENIVRHRTELGESAASAAYRGTSEIGLAVLATTLSIAAVFVPVAFMDGMVGQFFYQFGLTVAAAVMISLFVSFTMTPMLSARWLSDHHGTERGLSRLIELALRWIEGLYRRTVAGALRFWPVTLLVAVATLALTLAASRGVGFEFMPIQDSNQFSVAVELPVGTALEETASVAESLAGAVRDVPGVESTFVTVGGGVEEKVNTATVLVNLIPHADRAYHQTEIMAFARELLAGRQDVVLSVTDVSPLGAGDRREPVQIGLSGNDLEQLGAIAGRVAERLRETPGFVDVDTTYRTGKPELDVVVDPARASDLGLLGVQIGQTVRALVSGEVATQLSTGGDRVDVRVQLPPEQRRSAGVIEASQLRTPTGELVEVRDVADVESGSGPTQIDRQSRQRQVMLYANLEGVPLGDAMATVESILGEELPAEVTWTAEGTAKELAKTLASMLFAMGLAILCVYMILASQFESFLHPFTIMVSLPFALIGAFGGLILFDVTMSIFGMIGMIMLMGLVTKNAILLVDYANQLRAEGRAVREALIEAGAVRLRPILMTTAAMIFGMLPIAIGHGDGGEVRRPLGVIVIGGLISSTFLTLLVVPVVYSLIDRVSSGIGRIFGGHRIT
jgi:HAE1 family hydrophobic/amphiphilic exporter-1